MIGRTAIVATLLVVAGLSSFASPGAHHYALAKQQLSRGERQDASRSLLVSVELDPTHSDAHYRLAIFYAEDQIAKSMAHLEQAIAADRFGEIALATARLALARRYVKTGRLVDAESLLRTQSAGGGAETQYLLAEINRQKGQETTATEIARRGVGLFPESADLYLILFRLLQEHGRQQEAERVLEIGVQTVEDPLRVEAALLIERSGSPEFGDRLAEYRRSGGRDPAVYVAAMQDDPTEKYLEGFFQWGGHRDLSLLRAAVVHTRRDRELSESMQNRLRDYTGVRVDDSNQDGFPDRHYQYHRGQLVSWAQDSDQDGAEELFYEAEAPALTIVSAGYNAKYQYSVYPYLDRVVYRSASGAVTYQLPALQVIGPVLDGVLEPAERVAVIALNATIPSERALREASTKIEVADNAGRSRLWIMDRNVVRIMWADEDADGHLEYVIRYQDGDAAWGQRDLDGDGFADVQERWSDGRLRELLVDLDHNDIAETLLDPALMKWDTGGDGSYDQQAPVSDWTSRPEPRPPFEERP